MNRVHLISLPNLLTFADLEVTIKKTILEMEMFLLGIEASRNLDDALLKKQKQQKTLETLLEKGKINTQQNELLRNTGSATHCRTATTKASGRRKTKKYLTPFTMQVICNAPSYLLEEALSSSSKKVLYCISLKILLPVILLIEPVEMAIL